MEDEAGRGAFEAVLSRLLGRFWNGHIVQGALLSFCFGTLDFKGSRIRASRERSRKLYLILVLD